MAGGEKTEAPTPKRKEDVKKKGQVPRSHELNSVLGLLAAVIILRTTGGNLFTQITGLMGNNFRNLTANDWTAASITSYGTNLGMTFLAAMAPLFGALMIIGVAGSYSQGGLILTFKPMLPDFSRINPGKGFKRIFSKRALLEFVKSILKLGIVGFIVYQTFQDKYPQIVSLSGSDLRGAAGVIANVGLDILLKAGFALMAVAAMDYAYQRWEFQKNLKMTKEEVKEELRQSEGDPKIKSKLRQQQKQMASRRMMRDVPAADVIITNPTHLAVAIQYRPESMRAPKVTAKGQLLVAERIKELARQHHVPVIENKPLAQALYKSVEIGSEIPSALYHAVAEVLAFIYSLKRNRRLGGRGIGS